MTYSRFRGACARTAGMKGSRDDEKSARAKRLDELKIRRMHSYQEFRFSVAPMMDWTDRHCRVFHRAPDAPRAALYRDGDGGRGRVRPARAAARLRRHASIPSRCSSAASDPSALAEAARIGADFGYDEINLNCGCPSDRVQSGRFGACLMREPALVGECVAAMTAAVAVPVTVKCRIGVDEQEPRAALDRADRGRARRRASTTVIVHARKAWLDGLSARRRTATFRRSTMPASIALKRAASRSADRDQWRHRRPRRGAGASRAGRRRHARPRRLSVARNCCLRRSAALRRAGAGRRRLRGGRGLRALYRARARAGACACTT